MVGHPQPVTPNIHGVFHHAIRVRYSEVDQQGVVFNAHYLAYCDDAFDTWLRQLAPEFEHLGWDVMLKATAVEWHGGAGVAETIDFVLRVERWGRTSFDVAMEASVADRPVVSVRSTYVVVDRASLSPGVRPTPVAIPDQLREHLGG